ncbi:hypothetical protein BU15DRAFT_87558 [Melanogaster broomeanus]|nr:hypothetical protein BU15DRAFT_87558 [Melanogaster broomeanus]
MQAVQRNPGQPPPVCIVLSPSSRSFDTVASRCQVYECMVRGIAVMRRRGDSYVNATQILKVAGIEKGKRTKILEKEILPGKHEIVQGGYGKYQGTWIPLDRGRDIAAQYGVAPLLVPLFDFTPSTTSLGSLPAGNAASTSRPLSASSSFSGIGTAGAYSQSGLAPAPIMPGSALRLLNQGRAQGLFTPSTSALAPSRSAILSQTAYQSGYALSPGPTPTSIPQSLKRARSDSENQHRNSTRLSPSFPVAPNLPHPTTAQSALPPTRPVSRMNASSPQPPSHPGSSCPPSMVNGVDAEGLALRFSTKPAMLHDPSALRDSRRAQLIAVICRQDEHGPVFDILRELAPDPSLPADIDTILDDKGHTALHLAASMGRQNTVEQLIAAGADVHRGNYAGETPLMRASIDTHNSDQQSFNMIVRALHQSIRTLDTSRKSVLHHIMYLAGVQGRAVYARYYLDQIFMWIAQNQGGDFRSITLHLNIAARVGNRSLVRTLLDVGANRILPNKLGLRPGDFGVEVEELSGGPRAEDLLASLRTGPSAPVQKSQDIITDMTTMIQNLSTEFSTEIKSKQDSLDVTQAHLRAATRELSEQRKANPVMAKPILSRRGQLRLDRQDGPLRRPYVPMAQAELHCCGGCRINGHFFNVEIEPPIPTTDDVASLMRLRRLKIWQLRMEELMETRLRSLQGASAEKEYQCKKVVALCTGIPIDRVEDMLENLVIAMESEAQVVDIVRVSGFMQKVRDGVI